MLHSALRRWLHPSDRLLGPWQAGRDPLERALHAFEGVAGGPHVAPWQAGSRAGIGYAMDDDEAGLGAEGGGSGGQPGGTGGGSAGGAAPAPSPYPQPRALGAALLEAQLALVGRIFASVAPVNQAAILDALVGIAQGGPQKRKDREPAKRQAAATAAAAAALAGVAALAAGGRGALQAAGGELAPRMRQLADEVLEEAGGSPALQRAAADLYAAAVQLGSDGAAAALVRQLCREMAETASLPRRAALALAVGSAGRAVGGLGLQGVLPTATETLVAVARASDRSIRCTLVMGILWLSAGGGCCFRFSAWLVMHCCCVAPLSSRLAPRTAPTLCSAAACGCCTPCCCWPTRRGWRLCRTCASCWTWRRTCCCRVRALQRCLL